MTNTIAIILLMALVFATLPVEQIWKTVVSVIVLFVATLFLLGASIPSFG